MTLAEALKQHRGVGPGFHFLRHALSLTIMLHHCRVMIIGVEANQSYTKGALTAELTYGQIVVELLRPGLFALVGMFFALSGFLVIGSALRNSNIRVFFANRALRILPALSVEVTLSALLLGPLVTTVSMREYFHSPDLFRYFGNILGFVQFTLPGVFIANPWPSVVNGNLWTLPPEFWCYFLMLLLLGTRLTTQRGVINNAVGLVMICSLFLSFYDSGRFSVKQDTTHFTVWYIVLLFFLGVVFYVNADRVVLSRRLFLASGLAYYVLTLFGYLGPVSGLFLTYCTIYVGMMSFPLFDKLVKSDLSYGIYLYGFPISQAVVFFLLPHLGDYSLASKLLLIFPSALMLTCIFASLSWRYIEKPALSLRKHVLGASSAPVESRS